MTLDGALVTALHAFAAAPARVIALDFDGVLAPLVPRPADATPLPESVAALRRLATARATHLGLVSGRAAGDAALGRAALPGAVIVGSHGAETAVVTDDGDVVVQPSPLPAAQGDLLDRLHQEAARLVSTVPGAWVETKPTAVVVHTRPVTDLEAAAALEESAAVELGRLPGVRAIAGKRVVELSVAHATKADAVAALRRGVGEPLPGGTPVLYAGDDVTDEDALRVLGPGDVGVKVGTGPTVAEFRVTDPGQVAVLLGRIADLLGV